ncbi:MAG: spore coat protein YlbD [bacterium]|nr:spore coat protein YlbD [bacterium]
MSKETFKTFVKDNPSLIKFVNNNSMTWQKFYEMFELYGKNNDVWSSYLNNTSNVVNATAKAATSTVGVEGAIKELVTAVKGINLDKVQKGINSLQKTISMVQELGATVSSKESYEPKPIYKHFDD